MFLVASPFFLFEKQAFTSVSGKGRCRQWFQRTQAIRLHGGFGLGGRFLFLLRPIFERPIWIGDAGGFGDRLDRAVMDRGYAEYNETGGGGMSVFGESREAHYGTDDGIETMRLLDGKLD